MLQALQQMTRRDMVIAAVAIVWNVATGLVMVVGDRPDWALMMIVPYGFFTMMYCNREVEVVVKKD
jgi:hypothetical protein